jgi:hypothetical protein
MPELHAYIWVVLVAAFFNDRVALINVFASVVTAFAPALLPVVKRKHKVLGSP